MTDSGAGQRDDRPADSTGSGSASGSESGDSDTAPASWESSRGSGWENTTPYESPWAPPRSAGTAASGTAASGASAAEQPADRGTSAPPPAAGEDGPWPTYPEPDDRSQPGYGVSTSYGTPRGYGQPAAYPPPPPDPSAYGQPTAYGQQPTYGQQPDYGQQPTYGQQPGYGVNPYQQPVYGAGYVLPNHPQATTALVLGIVGLALCPFVGIGGFVLGGRARREIDASPGQWSGRGVATAGWVLGIIASVYAALVLVYVVVLGVVAVSSI